MKEYSKIKDSILELTNDIEQLLEENKRLRADLESCKSGLYREKLIASLSESLTEARERNDRFGFSPGDWEKIMEWGGRHNAECTGAVYYEIVPYELGTLFYCKCDKCKRKAAISVKRRIV